MDAERVNSTLMLKTVAGAGHYEIGSCMLKAFREWVGFLVEFTWECRVRLVWVKSAEVDKAVECS